MKQVAFIRDLIHGMLDPTDKDSLRLVFTGAIAATPQVDRIGFFKPDLMILAVEQNGACLISDILIP